MNATFVFWSLFLLYKISSITAAVFLCVGNNDANRDVRCLLDSGGILTFTQACELVG